MVKHGKAGAAIAAALAFGSAPALAGPTVREITELTDISGLAISPDGEWLAYREEHPSIEVNRVLTSWHVARLSGRTPARVADGGEAIFDGEFFSSEAPLWSKDARWIYYRALFGGEVQVWRAARDGSAAEQVTHDDANVLAFQLRDDGTVIYRVGATRAAVADTEEREYDDGIRFDRTIEPGQAIFRGGNDQRAPRDAAPVR
ncbi:hypothetical protein KRR38_08505 [Novosphingobium sp. G106]|uniref:TolB family protein n=1 Tax=Novosphingobium sp. G106 TaxID=2849500 RepID=UPI001C2D1973|nr:hypothetical protein [Novosphingobium sp. G106]MBV1687714.1 hypothetical protein [Novosphingobium sp. G106]